MLQKDEISRVRKSQLCRYFSESFDKIIFWKDTEVMSLKFILTLQDEYNDFTRRKKASLSMWIFAIVSKIFFPSQFFSKMARDSSTFRFLYSCFSIQTISYFNPRRKLGTKIFGISQRCLFYGTTHGTMRTRMARSFVCSSVHSDKSLIISFPWHICQLKALTFFSYNDFIFRLCIYHLVKNKPLHLHRHCSLNVFTILSPTIFT